MKTYKRLFEKIVSFENLWESARRARRGKRLRPNVQEFDSNLEAELFRLQEELQTGSYRPGAYREFTLRDTKRRLISAAPYRDRVVHHALCRIIEPLFERSFIFDSYACRVGKGTHAALDRFTEFARSNPFVLRCDIRKYFPSIDHQILEQLLERRIGCRRTMGLVRVILRGSKARPPSGEDQPWYYPGDDLFTPFTRRRGLPIGNQTSQFFANVYLNGFDHFVQEQMGFHGYLRYVDDFALFAPSKPALWKARDEVTRYLDSLRLTLHPRKSTVCRTADGVPFLGFRVFLTHRRLRRESVRRFVQRFRRQQAAYGSGRTTLEEVRRSTRAWIAHAQHANTYRLRAEIFGQNPFPRVCGEPPARQPQGG